MGANGKSSKVDDVLMTSIKKATRFSDREFVSHMGLKLYTSKRKGIVPIREFFAEEQRKL